MEIKIGTFTLTSDPLNFIITKTRKLEQARATHRKDPRSKKELIHCNASHYFGSLANAFAYMMEQGLRDSTATSLVELTKEQKQLINFYKDQFKINFGD